MATTLFMRGVIIRNPALEATRTKGFTTRTTCGPWELIRAFSMTSCLTVSNYSMCQNAVPLMIYGLSLMLLTNCLPEEKGDKRGVKRARPLFGLAEKHRRTDKTSKPCSAHHRSSHLSPHLTRPRDISIDFRIILQVCH
jgi:hypothetical protein